MKHSIRFGSGLCLFMFSASAVAIFKCVDERGGVTYSDTSANCNQVTVTTPSGVRTDHCDEKCKVEFVRRKVQRGDYKNNACNRYAGRGGDGTAKGDARDECLINMGMAQLFPEAGYAPRTSAQARYSEAKRADPPGITVSDSPITPEIREQVQKIQKQLDQAALTAAKAGGSVSSGAVQFNDRKSQGCFSRLDCPTGRECVRVAGAVGSGTCAKPVDEFGNKVYTRSPGLATEVAGCDGLTDCAIGFRCVRQMGSLKGVCMK
jgi:hypothetical protein